MRSSPASNAGGIACHAASMGCALISFSYPNTVPSCFKGLPVCVPWCVLSLCDDCLPFCVVLSLKRWACLLEACLCCLSCPVDHLRTAPDLRVNLGVICLLPRIVVCHAPVRVTTPH